jgi:hypothetical protein
MAARNIVKEALRTKEKVWGTVHRFLRMSGRNWTSSLAHPHPLSSVFTRMWCAWR